MGSALPGMMQITLAMRSVADHGRRPLYQCLPAMRCTRENNDKHSQRPVGQLCTSRNGIVGLPPPPPQRENEGGRVTYFNCWQARDARWAQLARPHDIPACLPDMKGFRLQVTAPSRRLRLRYSSKSAHFFWLA